MNRSDCVLLVFFYVLLFFAQGRMLRATVDVALGGLDSLLKPHFVPGTGALTILTPRQVSSIRCFKAGNPTRDKAGKNLFYCR